MQHLNIVFIEYFHIWPDALTLLLNNREQVLSLSLLLDAYEEFINKQLNKLYKGAYWA